jgi:hypothetical protein
VTHPVSGARVSPGRVHSGPSGRPTGPTRTGTHNIRDTSPPGVLPALPRTRLAKQRLRPPHGLRGPQVMPGARPARPGPVWPRAGHALAVATRAARVARTHRIRPRKAGRFSRPASTDPCPAAVWRRQMPRAAPAASRRRRRRSGPAMAIGDSSATDGQQEESVGYQAQQVQRPSTGRAIEADISVFVFRTPLTQGSCYGPKKAEAGLGPAGRLCWVAAVTIRKLLVNVQKL